MRRVLPLLLLTFAIAAGRSEALTIRDIIDLSRAGLTEEILLALIEVDRRVFPVDPDTLKLLRDARVPERVIVAVIRSGRTEPSPQVPAEAKASIVTQTEPQVIVIDHHEPPTQVVREIAVPVPVYVPVTRYRRSHSRLIIERATRATVHAQLDIPYPPIGLPHPPLGLQPEPPKKAEPVYWGWGGQLRPDAWKPK